MSGGVVVSILFALALVAYVAMPLLRRAEAAVSAHNAEAWSRSRELQSRHAMLLASLQDLEEDMRTDKLSPQDYKDLKTKLTVQAVATMKELDAAEVDRNNPPPQGPRRIEGA